MKLIKILMLAAVLSMLPACVALTKSANLVVPPPLPRLTKPDSALVQKCAGPIDIGDKALTQADVERLWISDRQRLLTCIGRHLALRDFYADRDAGLSGKVVTK